MRTIENPIFGPVIMRSRLMLETVSELVAANEWRDKQVLILMRPQGDDQWRIRFFASQFLVESLAAEGQDKGPSLDYLIDKGLAIVGDPDSVIEQIRRQQRQFNAGTFMIYAPFATLPLDMAFRNLELFAKAEHHRVYKLAGPKSFEDYWRVFPSHRDKWPGPPQ